MKSKTNKNLNILGVVLALFMFVPNSVANEFGITDAQLSEIQTRVNSMSPAQLNNRYAELKTEQRMLEAEASENPSQRDQDLHQLTGWLKFMLNFLKYKKF